jgi:hypothetical protein
VRGAGRVGALLAFTFWVPIWAANAAPVRPANTIAVISAPSSRSIASPTPFTTKITAPNCRATSPISKAMMTLSIRFQS